MKNYAWGYTGFPSVEDAVREALKISVEENRKISEIKIVRNGGYYDCSWNFELTEWEKIVLHQ